MRLPKQKTLLASLCLFILLALYQRFAPADLQFETTSPQEKPAVQGIKVTPQEGTVTKVVDGDTIQVIVQGTKQKVRIIGINTPESVDPRRGVQCFGKEASTYAKEFLQGKAVRLESDPSQTNQDKYDRLLRYVWIGSMDFGKHMIEQGYAHEYTYDVPYAYQADYQAAQQQAQIQKKGFWADTACAEASQ